MTNIKIEISIDIYKHQKTAVLKINETEIGRLTFDQYEYDTHSIVFYIDDKDVINIDYDVLTEW
jgi:hypothetical protein